MLGVILGVVLIAFGIFVATPYQPDDTAKAVLSADDSNVQIDRSVDDQIAFVPKNPVAGYIFLQGARLNYESYAPLMKQLAEKGILCVDCHFFLNMYPNSDLKTDEIMARFPQVKNWYIGGHSMGAKIALSYANKNPERHKGVIVMGCNPDEDMTQSSLSLLTFYAENDGLVPPSEYDDFKDKVPVKNMHVEIKGGCHANYGNYGEQWMDGTPTISHEEQQKQVVDAVVAFLAKN